MRPLRFMATRARGSLRTRGQSYVSSSTNLSTGRQDPLAVKNRCPRRLRRFTSSILMYHISLRSHVRSPRCRQWSHHLTSPYATQVTLQAIIAMAMHLNIQPITGMGIARLYPAEVPVLHTLLTHPPKFNINTYSKPNSNNNCSTPRLLRVLTTLVGRMFNVTQSPSASKRTLLLPKALAFQWFLVTRRADRCSRSMSVL